MDKNKLKNELLDRLDNIDIQISECEDRIFKLEMTVATLSVLEEEIMYDILPAIDALPEEAEAVMDNAPKVGEGEYFKPYLITSTKK